MRIYTLGTSHGDSTLVRFNSSTVYETKKGTLYLIDPGAPVEALMKRKGLSCIDLKACFITHMHDDHVGGITSLFKEVNKYSSRRSRAVSLGFPEERAIDGFKAWFSMLHEDPDSGFIKYFSVDDGTVYEDEEISVTAIRTKHLKENKTSGVFCSFAYVLYFKEEGKRVLHSGDLSRDFSDFPKIAFEEHFDACVCEATHYDPEIARDAFLSAKFDRLIFSHIGERWHNEMKTRWQTVRHEFDLLEYCKDYPYPAVVAHDGDEFLI